MKKLKLMSNSRRMAWLIYAIIVTALIGSVTLARYTTTVTGTGMATIAAMNMEMNTQSLDFAVTDLKSPGSTDTLVFQVVNFTDTEIDQRVCDVNQDYTITVSTTGNLPLTFSLAGQIPGEINTNGHTGQLVSLGSVTPQAAHTGGRFEHTYATTHTYTLTVTWPGTEKNPKLADEIDLITVTVQSEQTISP